MKKELIRKINIYKCPIRLKEPFIISLGRLDYADNVLVVIETSSGKKGFGECSPFQTIHGENGKTCMVVGEILARQLVGRDALSIEACSTIMDSTIFGNTSIKSAFDIALYDINSQEAGQPLYKFLGGVNSNKIVTDYTVSIGDAQKMAEDAERIVKKRFTVIKIKLGGFEEEDFIRVKTIREKVGNEIPIRVDANQGWTKDTAIRLLKRLEPFNIQHCEEPVSRKEFLSLAEIRSLTTIPLMADESCFDDADAKNLIQLKACDRMNIKLGKSSGIFKAIKVIRVAEESNIKLQAGGFLESRLGFTAMAHVVLSSNQFEYFDFDTPLMFSEDPVSGGMKYLENGRIKIPDLPGLGATIPEHFLQTLEKKSIY